MSLSIFDLKLTYDWRFCLLDHTERTTFSLGYGWALAVKNSAGQAVRSQRVGSLSRILEMGLPTSKRPNAIKHAGFSAATLLPGESAAEFEELHQALIAEFRPKGVLEEETVDSLAHLLWRKKNLVTFRTAHRAQQRVIEIQEEMIQQADPIPALPGGFSDPNNIAESERAAEANARRELRDLYRFVEMGEEATVACLLSDLAIHERLDAMIDKCLKRLLPIRGIKSVS
jgi:hypothetical protein